MKLGHIMAAAVLLAPIPFVGMTEPAAAASTHTVVLSGTLFAYDGGSVFGSGDDKTKDFDKRVNLTHDEPRARLKFVECAGDETRAELSVELRLTQTESVSVQPTLYLYEESACNNTDRDGSQQATARRLAGGQSRHWFLKVFNDEASSFDFVWADLTVTHNVVPPKEPSELVASHVQGDMHTIHLAWEDNATDETGYEIRNTTTNQTHRVAPNTTKLKWNSPIRFKQCFQIRALGDPNPSNWTPTDPQAVCGY
jgi:hypothetical protein